MNTTSLKKVPAVADRHNINSMSFENIVENFIS